MAKSNNLSRWYVVLFFIFVILVLIISAYNLYETYRIKSQVPKEYQESQDILFVLNIIAIVIAILLLIGYYFAGDKSLPNNYAKQAINLPIDIFQSSSATQSLGQGSFQVPAQVPVQGPAFTPSPFCRTGPVDINRL